MWQDLTFVFTNLHSSLWVKLMKPVSYSHREPISISVVGYNFELNKANLNRSNTHLIMILNTQAPNHCGPPTDGMPWWFSFVYWIFSYFTRKVLWMQTNMYLERLKLCYGMGSCSVSFSKIKIFYIVTRGEKKKRKKKAASMQWKQKRL